MQRGLTALLVAHGLIHGVGFIKAFGVAALPQLTSPISRPLGLLWLMAALCMVASGFVPARMFWSVGALALVCSQVCIGTAWPDAKLGTWINGVVLLAVVYSFACSGPLSFAAEYARDVVSALRRPTLTSVVTETELEPLPAPVQRYLRATGAVGQARVYNFRARWTGRIRSDASAPYMPIAAEQVNTLGVDSQRFFKMTATMKGLPVDIYHRFVGADATFRVRLLSLFPMVNAQGPELNRAETVTLLNDLCLLAPAALLDPALTWQPLDEHRARVTFTRGAQTVRAELRFDDAGELVDFTSDDRLRAAPDGRSFTRTRWSTPAGSYREFGGRRVTSQASALWHAPTGTFAYAELALQDITYNVVSR